MFAKVTSRIGKTALNGLVIAGLGIGIVGGAGAAHAQDNRVVIGDGTPCYFDGAWYPEGTMLTIDYRTYVCLAGAWVDAPEAVTGTPGSVKPVKGRFNVPSRNAVLSAE